MILLPMVECLGALLRADNMTSRPKSSRQISAKTNTPSSELALRMGLVRDLYQPGHCRALFRKPPNPNTGTLNLQCRSFVTDSGLFPLAVLLNFPNFKQGKQPR